MTTPRIRKSPAVSRDGSPNGHGDPRHVSLPDTQVSAGPSPAANAIAADARGAGLAARIRLGHPDTLIATAMLLFAVSIGLIIITWYRVGHTIEVGRQMPMVVSGGLGGIVTAILAAGILAAGTRRRSDAIALAQLNELRRLRARTEADDGPH